MLLFSILLWLLLVPGSLWASQRSNPAFRGVSSFPPKKQWLLPEKSLLLKIRWGNALFFLCWGGSEGKGLAKSVRQTCQHFSSLLQTARKERAEYLDEINLSWQEYLFYWPKSWFSHLFSLQLWAIIGIYFFIYNILKYNIFNVVDFWNWVWLRCCATGEYSLVFWQNPGNF